ncbi:MAG: hypothetical protein KJ712_07600, partial [Bacteroidetes bacterium]|nr:hypothetical protein [Bacteroidota bacterium]
TNRLPFRSTPTIHVIFNSLIFNEIKQIRIVMLSGVEAFFHYAKRKPKTFLQPRSGRPPLF